MYRPTHTVPTEGMVTYAEPDPGLAPGPGLDPGLDVQVVEERGAWAKVLCSNGWTAWVDGRLLIAQPGPVPDAASQAVVTPTSAVVPTPVIPVPAPILPTPRAGDYAEFGPRLGAFAIDVVLLLLVGVVMMATGLGALSPFVGAAYFIYFTGSRGATLGKQALKLKVVNADGTDCEYGTAAMREIVGKFLSALMLGIGYLLPLWDERKQALHDKVAKTFVVKTG